MWKSCEEVLNVAWNCVYAVNIYALLAFLLQSGWLLKW